MSAGDPAEAVLFVVAVRAVLCALVLSSALLACIASVAPGLSPFALTGVVAAANVAVAAPEPAVTSPGRVVSTVGPGPAAIGPPPAAVVRSHGLRARRGYLNLSPGILALFGFRWPAYAWGIDGGYHFPGRGNFAVQVGGFLEHLVPSQANLIRLGPMARFGGGHEKIFAYGLARLGGDLLLTKFPGHHDTIMGFHASLGGGVMGLVHPRVTLGGEPAVDLFVVLTGATDMLSMVRFRVFAGWLF